MSDAVSLPYQQAMAKDSAIRRYTLNTSHSAFFTQPGNLANILMAEVSR